MYVSHLPTTRTDLSIRLTILTLPLFSLSRGTCEDGPSECQSIRCMQQLEEWDRNAVEERERALESRRGEAMQWKRRPKSGSLGGGGGAQAGRQGRLTSERASERPRPPPPHQHQQSQSSSRHSSALRPSARQCVAVRGPVPNPGPIMQWKQRAWLGGSESERRGHGDGRQSRYTFYVDVLPCLIMRVKLDSIQIPPSFPFVTAGSCLSS